MGLERFHGPENPRLDRAFADVERARDFRVGHPVIARKDERLALLVGEFESARPHGLRRWQCSGRGARPPESRARPPRPRRRAPRSAGAPSGAGGRGRRSSRSRTATRRTGARPSYWSARAMSFRKTSWVTSSASAEFPSRRPVNLKRGPPAKAAEKPRPAAHHGEPAPSTRDPLPDPGSRRELPRTPPRPKRPKREHSRNYDGAPAGRLRCGAQPEGPLPRDAFGGKIVLPGGRAGGVIASSGKHSKEHPR